MDVSQHYRGEGSMAKRNSNNNVEVLRGEVVVEATQASQGHQPKTNHD